MNRATCEELTTTLARAMVALAKLHPKTRSPALALVRDEEDIGDAVMSSRGGQHVR